MFSQPKRAEARLTLRDRVRDESSYAALSDAVLAVRAALIGEGGRIEHWADRLPGRIAEGEEDVELHPVCNHADPVAPGGDEIECRPDDELCPYRGLDIGLYQQVDRRGIEQGRQVPELI